MWSVETNMGYLNSPNNLDQSLSDLVLKISFQKEIRNGVILSPGTSTELLIISKSHVASGLIVQGGYICCEFVLPLFKPIFTLITCYKDRFSLVL